MADKGVLILPSFYEAMKPLPAEEQLQLFHAICEFGIYANEPDPDTLSPTARGFFMLIRPVLEASSRRYEASVANGNKGGRGHKKGNQFEPSENQSKTRIEPSTNQSKTRIEPSTKQDIDIDTDTDSDIDSEKNNDSNRDFVPGCTPKQQRNEENSNSTSFNSNSTLASDYITPTPTKNKRKKFTPPALEDVQQYCAAQGLSIDAARFVDYYAANGWMVGKNPMRDWQAAARNWCRGTGNGSGCSNQPSKPRPVAAMEDEYETAFAAGNVKF